MRASAFAARSSRNRSTPGSPHPCRSCGPKEVIHFDGNSLPNASEYVWRIISHLTHGNASSIKDIVLLTMIDYETTIIVSSDSSFIAERIKNGLCPISVGL
jgi:hypothetical protein